VRATLGYLALTIVLAYPFSLHPASTVLSDAPDTDLTMWILAWDAHALLTAPLRLFDANIFAPDPDTLAYSENLLGSVPIAAPVLWLTGNPVLAMNLVALLSAVLCGTGAWLLARRLGLSPAGAFVAGLVYAFAPPRFLRLDQLHLATVQWLPFSLAFLHTYLGGGRPRDLRLAIFFFVLQAFTSGHGAVFSVVAILVLLGWHGLRGVSWQPARWLSDAGLAGTAMLLTLGLLTIPYLSVQRHAGLKRTLDSWSVPWESYLASPTHVDRAMLSAVSAEWIDDAAGAYLFPGVVPLVLVGIALLPGRRSGAGPTVEAASAGRGVAAAAWLEGLSVLAALAALAIMTAAPIRWRVAGHVISVANSYRGWAVTLALLAGRVAISRNGPVLPRAIHRRGPAFRARLASPAAFYAALALLTLWLAAGPPISLWPAVYWLPGMNFIRQPSRFTIVTVLAIGGLAGMGAERLIAAVRPSARQAMSLLCAALLLLEFAALPLDATPRAVTFPAVDRWLAEQPGPFTIVELPLPDPGVAGPFERRQTKFMLHSMAHWQQTANGYSGFLPPRHAELYRALYRFPDQDAVLALIPFGVTRIVVHTDFYAPDEWARIDAELASNPHLQLLHVDGPGRVYALTP
jgi:hypothetical protein